MLKQAVVALWIVAAPAGQQLSVAFDPARTQIHWSLAGNVHTTHGQFRLKQGHVVLDATTGAISGELVADATSGDSGNSARDKRMHKDILESDRFPVFVFTPQKIEGAVSAGGHSTVRVGGVFLVHGETHQVTVPVDVSFAGGEMTGTAKFSIPFVDWGMKDPSNFLFKVDKSVEVEIVAVGQTSGTK